MPSNNSQINIGVKYNVDQASVNAVKKSLQDLQNIKFKDFNGPKKDLDDIKQKASQVEAALTKAFNVNLNSLNTQAFNAELQKAGLNIDKIYTSFSKAGAQGQVAFSRMASEVLTTNMQLKQTNSLVSQMGETMANTVKWGIASSVMNNFTNSVRQAFDYVKALDSSLNDIRIVTKQSSEQMANFAVQANNSAQALGRSTMDYTKAALTFYQQGLDEASVQARTESVLKAQNITGAGQEMADYLTAVWNGYKVANEEAELYVDKLAAVADSSASNMSQLAIAMSKVASSANLLGVPVDNLNAQIATIVATTRQAPQSVGNALKTIYSRINDIATGADDAQISLGNYSSKMAQVGINVLDANGKLRDTGDVIDEIGGKWETLSHEQQIYLARTMAGQRQYNNLLALFENWGKYSDLVNVSMEAQGATAQKNAIYLESLGAKLEQLGAAGEKVKSALIDEDDLKGLVDFGTGAVNLFGNLIQSIGGGKGALLAFGSIFTQVFSGTIAKELNNVITHFQDVGSNLEKQQERIKQTQLFGQSQGYQENGGVKAMVDAQREAKDYYSFMSAAEQNAYNELVKRVGAAQDEVTLLKDEVDTAKEFKAALEQAAEQGGETLDGQLVLVNEKAEDLKSTLDDLKGQKGLELFNDADTDVFGILLDKVEALREAVGEGATEAFDKFDNKLEEVLNFPAGGDPTELAKKLSELRDAAQGVFNDVYSKNNLVLNLDQTSQALKEATAEAKIAKQAQQDYLDAVKQFANIKTFVNMAAGIGQVASGIANLVNITKIWGNENLSAGQKILQTFTNLSMTIPMLVNGFTKVAEGFNKIVDIGKLSILSKKEEAKATLEAVAAKGADATADVAGAGAALINAKAQITLSAALKQVAVDAWAAIAPFAPFIAVAAAVGVAIYAMYKQWNRQADAAKKAAQVAKQTKETYDDLKSSYDNLKSSLEDYNSAQEAISQMTKGTQEWRDAIRESNDAVLDLIQSYPELASAVQNVNGQLILSEQGQQQALLNASTAVDNARLANIAATTESREASLRSDARNASRFAGQITYSGQFIQATTDQVMNLVEAYSTATDRSVQALAEQTGMSEQLVSSILNEIDNMDQLVAQLQANTEATKLSYEAMAAQSLQGNKVYEGLDDLGKQIAQTIAGRDLQQQTDIGKLILEDQDFKHLKRNSNADAEYMQNILKRFRDAMGDQSIGWNTSGWGPTEGAGGAQLNFLINGEQLQYTKQQVVATIAAAQALQNLEVSAQKASQMLAGMQTTGQADALKTFTAGNGFGDFTQSELRSINPKSHEMAVYFNTFAEQAGYTSGKAYQDAFIEAVQSDIAKFDKIGYKYLKDVSLAYKEFKDKDISLGVAQDIAKNLNQAFIHGGQQGLDSLKNVFKNLSSQDLQKLLSNINQIDWTQDGAANQLKEIIKEQGIAVDLTDKSWQTFINLLQKVSSKSIDAATNLDNLRGVVSSLKDVDTGDILKDQDYQQLIKLVPELKDSFKIADEGYMFIGTQQQVADALKTTTQQTISQLQQMDKVATQIAQKDFSEQIGKIDFGAADNYHLNSESIQALHNISQDQALSNALAIMGISQQAFKEAQSKVEYYGGAKYQLSKQMKESYDQARTIIEDVLKQITELQTQGQQGVYQLALRQTQELAATRAQSLEELRNLYYEEQILLEDYSDMREVLIDKELDRLGITREQYDATYEQLQEHLEETSDSFNDLSEAEQQIQLDQLTSRVYDLGDSLDQLKGISENTFNEIQYGIQNNLDNLQGIEGFGQLQSILSEIFQTPISTEEIASNFDLIKQLAQGDITALVDLQAALGQDYIAQIAAEVDTPEVNAAMTELQGLINATQLDNLDVGISLDDAGFTEALQNFATLAGLSAEEINEILGRIGFEPQVTEQVIPFDEIQQGGTEGQYTYSYDLPQDMGGGTRTIRISADDYNTAKAAGSVTIPIINGKKTKYVGGSSTGSFARPNMSMPNSSGKPSGGGGAKDKKPTTVKPQKLSEAKDSIKDRSDVYHDINLALDKQEDILDDIQKEQKKLVNRDRLENLKKQNKQLEKQKSLLDQKSGIAATELVRLKNELVADLGNGIQFDSNGQIANYNEALDEARDNYNKSIDDYNRQVWAAEEAYNRYVDQYNSMSADEQEANKANLEKQKDDMDQIKKTAQKALDLEKEKYDAIKNNIKEYDDTLKLQRDIANQQQQIQDKIYENLIAWSKIKVDLSIDTGDFEREWLDFENKFIKKLDKDDFLGSAKASAKELMSYFNSDQIQKVNDQIKFIRQEITNMQAGGSSDIYGNNLAQAKEDLEEYMKQQMDDLGDIQDLVDDIKDNYLDALNDAKDRMDDQIDQYERVNDLIDHNVKLTEMLYGDKAYNTMNKYYELQKANNKDQLQSLKMQQEYWQNLFNNIQRDENDKIINQEEYQTIKENLDDITDQLNDKLEDMIENLSDQWENRVDGIIAKLNNALTGGRGLDFLDQQWDYINNFDDNFLDTFESKMGIDEVTSLYQQAIDGLSGSPANQQKINKLMNDQLKILREKDHLTEYDIERAKAALEVEKARMALEDVRYNKTKMRLRRDSQGNYTYQYVADEQKLGDLQAALADAQANLYNMDKEHYTENLNTLYDTYKNYLDKMRDLTQEYNSTQDEEERKRIQARIDLLKESTNNLMQGLTEDNKYTLQYLNESFFGGMGIDTSLYTAEQQMEIMTNNIPQMQSNIQDLANTIVGQGGILNATADAMTQISNATVEYDKNVRQFLQDAGTSLEIVEQVTDGAGNALDKNIVQAKDLITTNDELIKSCQAQVAAIQQLMSWLDQYMSKVMNVQTLIANLRQGYNTGQQLNGSNLTADTIAVTGMGLDTTIGMNFTGNPETDAAAIKQQIDKLMAQYEKFLTQMAIATFDTGGATGSWGDASGRLAFLHEKELVLNQTDTFNILRAVEAVRMMTSSLDSIASGEIGSLINEATGLMGGINTNSTLDQNVHIEANFPNVTQHTEIEQAFNNLVNMASMRASGYRD